MSTRLYVAIGVLVAIVLPGCITPQPTHRVNSGLGEKRKGVKNVLILPPQVDVFQVEAGGVPEKMDEWTNEARKQLVAALQGRLSGRFERVAVLPSQESLPPEVKANLEETEALFAVVDQEIIKHTYQGAELFPEKLDRFEYFLGREVEGLQREGADALILMRGINVLKSTGRKALEMAQTIIVGVLTGVVQQVQFETALVSVALVDARTGDLLWYNLAVTSPQQQVVRHAPTAIGPTDLRTYDGASGVIEGLFRDFAIP